MSSTRRSGKSPATSSTPPPAAVFVPDGARFVPTSLAQGPWDPRAQHGGAPAALIAGVVEATPPSDGVLVTRITFEFLRPVPLEPLEVTTEVVRPGRKVQLVAAAARVDGVEVVRALALRIRTADAGLPDGAETAPTELPGPEAGRDAWNPPGGARDVGFIDAMDMRFITGGLAPGPALVWMRLRRPIVAGERPSPLQRVVAAADFGNGVSALLDFRDYLFINPDLTVSLHRLPEGEWVCLEAATRLEPHGIGAAESALYDGRGRIGRSVQSLLVERAP